MCNMLLVALLSALSGPPVAGVATDTHTSPDRSAAAQLIAAGILIVVTILAVWFSKRRVSLTRRTVGIDLAAGTALSQHEWERIPQDQRSAWQKDVDYEETTTAGAKTFTTLKDLAVDTRALAANTHLSEAQWDSLPADSRRAWVQGEDYIVDSAPDVKTFKALRDLSVQLLLAPGADITDEMWNAMDPGQQQALRKGKDYRYQRGYWFRKLLVGADNRWSTSKFQALTWTYALVFGLMALILAKWMGNSEGWGALINMKPDDWDVYLLLLGGPFAALVLAKLTTSTKVENGTIDKTAAPTSTLDPLKGLGQVLGNDAGQADLGDTQYVVFNLVALMYFLGTLAGHLQDGFPPLPAILVGLTGVSAATYVTKKAAERAQPTLKSVVPKTQKAGETVDVWGSFLVAPAPTSPPPPGWGPRATVGGMEAARIAVVPDAGPTDHLRITIPVGAVGSAPIVVYTATGTATDPLDFTVREASGNQ